MPIISYHSQKKNGVKCTNIISVEVESKKDAEQISLFTEELWESAMMKVIEKFNTFYPSEIALLCTTLPPHDKMVGSFYRKLISQKKIHRTGQYRPSIKSSRRGGVEFEYLNLNTREA